MRWEVTPIKERHRDVEQDATPTRRDERERKKAREKDTLVRALRPRLVLAESLHAEYALNGRAIDCFRC